MGTRGGNREGAGRRRKWAEVAIVRRVPANVDIEAMVTLVDDLRAFVASTRVDLHPTSPRDQRVAEVLDELEQYLDATKATMTLGKNKS